MSSKQFECKLWKPIEDEDIILSKASFNNFGFDKHIHEEYALGVVSEGMMNISYDGINKSIGRKSLMTINPDTMHSNWSIDKKAYKQIAIYLHPSFISRFLEENYNLKEVFFKAKLLEKETLSNELVSLVNDYENDDVTLFEYECRLIGLLNNILLNNSSFCKNINQKHSLNNELTSKAKKFMQDNIDLDIRLDDIAKEMNLSKFHFTRIFKEESHFSPHTYLVVKRLEKAKQELQKGVNICQVAQNCGFSDQSHFTKKFKKYLGITPLKYQKFFK